MESTRTELGEQIAKFRQRPRSAKPELTIRDTALITGGIGDVFALESYLSDQHRERLTTILYATQKHAAIRQLFEALPNFPNLVHHKVVWDDFADFWHFLRKSEVVDKLGYLASEELRYSDDWSIEDKFPLLALTPQKYSYSSFLRYKLCDLLDVTLPSDPFVVIQPYSTDKRTEERDFTLLDWRVVVTWLTLKQLKGVVINQGNDYVPDHELLVDLSNRTNVLQAVEVLKAAKGYIGIDSWLTVLAAKLFPTEMIAIKSKITHCYRYKDIYFAPKKEFSFLASEVSQALNLHYRS